MGRVEASELNGGQPMAHPVGMAQSVGMPQPVGMPMVIQQPELGNIQGNYHQEHPAPGMVENFVNGRSWATNLFDCHENQTNAVMTAFLPCITFGQIAEVIDEGEMTCPLGSFIYLLMMPALCTHWIMGSKYRAKLRKQYNLVEAPYQDIVSHIFCPCCSLCQEFRELKLRGLDPALGWKGIQAQQQRGGQNQGPELRVPQNQGMYR